MHVGFSDETGVHFCRDCTGRECVCECPACDGLLAQNKDQEAVVKDADWGMVEHQLRYGVVAFLNNKGLRQRFQSLIPKHERQKFQQFGRTHAILFIVGASG